MQRLSDIFDTIISQKYSSYPHSNAKLTWKKFRFFSFLLMAFRQKPVRENNTNFRQNKMHLRINVQTWEV